MCKSLKFFLSIVFLAIFLSVSAQDKPDMIPGEVVVKLSDATQKQLFFKNRKVVALFEEFEVTAVEKMFPLASEPISEKNKFGVPLIDLSLFVRVSTEDDCRKHGLITALNQMSEVEYAEPRYIPALLSVPDDPLSGSQYYLDNIQAYDAWDIEQGDTNVVIAIVDTGVDMDHEDLIYNIAYNMADPLDGIDNDNDGFVDNYRGWDVGDNDNFPQNEMNPHGTWCSGLAVAHTDNGLGISGPAYNCRLLPVKIQDVDSLLTRSYEGIVYAADHGAKVINCSWGDNHFAQFEQDMITYAAINKDALVVAACGNDNNIRNFYPASYDYVLSVAATTSSDHKWTPENTGTNGGSSFGFFVDVAAPGTSVYSTHDGGAYKNLAAGTSFASPIVAGVAGIVRSKYPEMSALQCIERIKNTADVIDTIAYNLQWENLLGTGRVNMFKSVSADFKPGLVLENIQIFDDRENDYENTRIVEIHGEVFNYLSDAENVQIELSIFSGNADVLTPQVDLGAIDSLMSLPLNDGSVQLELSEEFNFDEQLVVQFTISDGDYRRIQYVPVDVLPSYKNISNGDLNLSVPANGRFGFVDYLRLAGNGMNYNEFTDLFYDSGWMMGTNPENLITAVRGVSEFEIVQASKMVDTVVADEMVRCFYRAYDLEGSLNLSVKQEVYAWNHLKNSMLIVAQITNENIVPLSDFYSGLFTDWDLYRYSRNHIGWDEMSQIAYVENVGDLGLCAGYVLLSGQSFNHYALDQSNNSDGLVDLTNGLSDEEKFYCMTHTKHSVGDNGVGTDVAQIFSVGPEDIDGMDTLNIAIGIIVAQSRFEMEIAADSLKARYDVLFPDQSLVNMYNRDEIEVYPNPSEGVLCIDLSGVSGKVDVRIVDAKGRVVKTFKLIESERNLQVELSAGQYEFICISDKELIRKKIVVVK